VAVDDDLREWWVGDRKDNRDRKFGGRERGGDKVPFSQPFKRAEGDVAEVDARAVEELIREREDAQKSRDYTTADGIRDELGRHFGVRVDDGQREWWVVDRNGNRNRKFGGRERGGREDAWGAGGGRERGERGRRERGGMDDAWGAGDGRERGEGGGRERGGRGGVADWGDRRDGGGSWGGKDWGSGGGSGGSSSRQKGRACKWNTKTISLSLSL
jgi:hypothetical protein